MNIYQPIAEFREAHARLNNAAAWLSVHLPPMEYAEGVLEARDMLIKLARQSFLDVMALEEAMRMDRDALFDMLAMAHGHAIYYGDETPLVRAMIHIYAEQCGRNFNYERCAQAVSNKWDADRLGDSL